MYTIRYLVEITCTPSIYSGEADWPPGCLRISAEFRGQIAFNRHSFSTSSHRCMPIHQLTLLSLSPTSKYLPSSPKTTTNSYERLTTRSNTSLTHPKKPVPHPTKLHTTISP